MTRKNKIKSKFPQSPEEVLKRDRAKFYRKTRAKQEALEQRWQREAENQQKMYDEANRLYKETHGDSSGAFEERSLLVYRGISHDEENNKLLFEQYPLAKELYKLGYPTESINSILQCGEQTDFITKDCNCGKKIIPLTHHCDNRTCPICSPRRLNRIRNKYLRFLQSFKPDGLHSHLFLTIGPPNYKDLKFGLEDIREKLTKWRKHKYIKERIKAGLFVIESKQKENFSWNIHSHMIVWSRHLDNRVRGNCLDCGQNLMGFSKEEGYFCANKKCNSKNIIVKKDSKLKSTWRELFNEECHFYVKKVGSVKSALNYMLKYITSQKEDFQDFYYEALYICVIKDKRLITSFGEWYNIDLTLYIIRQDKICKVCGMRIEFKWIPYHEGVYLLQEQNKPPPNSYDPSLNEKPIYEVIKM